MRCNDRVLTKKLYMPFLLITNFLYIQIIHSGCIRFLQSVSHCLYRHLELKEKLTKFEMDELLETRHPEEKSFPIFLTESSQILA